MKDKPMDTAGDMVSRVSLDSTGKQKSFRRLIKRFSEKTSMQGPPYINMAKFWWAKLIWAFLLLVAVVVMVLHLWYLFQQWYDYPKTTTISLGYDNLAFPQVTICNTNVLHKNRFFKFNGAKELKMLVEDLRPENFVPHQFEDDYDPTTDPNNPMNQEENMPPPDAPNQETPPPDGSNQGTPPPDGTNQGTPSPDVHNQETTTPDKDTHGLALPGGHQVDLTTQNVASVSTTQFSSIKPDPTKQPRQEEETLDRTSPSSNHRPKPTDGTKPNARKKRSGYDDIDISKYYEDYKNYEANKSHELDSPMDTGIVIENVFRELYMDIIKKNRRRLGHQIDDMLVGCTFSGRKCSSNMFTLHQTAEYGNCWTLASDRFRVKEAGPRGGLTLILFLEINEYLKGLSLGYGARVQFQEKDTYPFPFDEGVYISGATETSIGLKFRTLTRLGGNYGSCNDGQDFKNLYNLTYTRRACQAFCFITSIIKTCNCFDDHWEEFAFKNNETLRPCRSEKEQQCKLEVQNRVRSGGLSCKCDNPCREVEYLKTVSSRQWPTNEYSRVLLDWLCDRDPQTCKSIRKKMDDIWEVKNNFVRLNIYYEDLNFENITETQQIELQQFLSDIGGAFGLWIGLSILSLCEVIQLFIELFDYGIHTARNTQQVNTKHKDKNVALTSTFSPKSDKEKSIPRIVLDPFDPMSDDSMDTSSYRERSKSSDWSSDVRENHHRDRHRLSPDLRRSRDRSHNRSNPELKYSSERDNSGRSLPRHGYDSPRRVWRQGLDRYPEFRDDFGLNGRTMMY